MCAGPRRVVFWLMVDFTITERVAYHIPLRIKEDIQRRINTSSENTTSELATQRNQEKVQIHTETDEITADQKSSSGKMEAKTTL